MKRIVGTSLGAVTFSVVEAVEGSGSNSHAVERDRTFNCRSGTHHVTSLLFGLYGYLKQTDSTLPMSIGRTWAVTLI